MSIKDSTFRIREFVADDYPAIAEIHNELFPDHLTSSDDLVVEDSRRDSRLLSKRWIVEMRGRAVAYGGYWQWLQTYKPTEFTLVGGVRKKYRSLGIGSELYETVMRELTALKPTVVRAHSRSDRIIGIRFLQKRGFKEFMRDQDWELDATAFDPAPFQAAIEKHTANGIEIKTVCQLESDPDRNRKLYDMIYEILEDTPGAELTHKLDFETWVEKILMNPKTPQDGFFVAVCKNQYVGKTHFQTQATIDSLFTNLTGTRKPFRRRGIAMALKVRSIEWAQANGYKRIITDNESNNLPMLALNDRLGFKKLPAWIFFERKFKIDPIQTQGKR